MRAELLVLREDKDDLAPYLPKRAKSPTYKKFSEKEFDTVQTAHFNGT